MNDPLDKFYKVIEDMKAKGLYNNIRTISSPQGAYLVANDKKVLNLCSNNYLGLAANERLVAAVRKAVDEHGVGTGAVRTLSGTIDLHIKL